MSGKLLPRLEFEFFCAKCSNRYVVVTTQSMIDRGKYRKHCSLKCANGHIHSESWKANVSERLKGRSYPERQNPLFELTCRCGKKFSSKNHKSLYCSRSCTSIYGRDFSHINKQAYVNGKIQAGGTTKWFTYNDIRVQGTYELRACHILDRMKERQDITGW